MKKWLLSVCLATTAAAAAPLSSGKISGFDRYKLILERQPFGVVPPPPVAAVTKPVTAADSFAKNLKITAFLEVDDEGLKVGFIDSKTKKDYLMEVGDSEDGIELVSADYNNEEAVFRKDSEMAVIKLQSGNVQPLNAAEQQLLLPPQPQPQPQPQSPSQPQSQPRTITMPRSNEARIDSYIERRKAREMRRQQIIDSLAQPPPTPTPTPEAKPQYTPEELLRKIQEYQEEAARQGLPPLPLPPTEGTGDNLSPEEEPPPSN